MARGFNPLQNLLRNSNDIEKLVNPYDDGSIWSKPEEVIEPKKYSVLDITNDNISGFNPLSSFSTPKSPIEDPLQAPRNQIQYFTNQLNDIGVEPEKPKNNGGGFGKLLEKLSVIQSSLSNAISGGFDKQLELRNKLGGDEMYNPIKMGADGKMESKTPEELNQSMKDYRKNVSEYGVGKGVSDIMKGSVTSFVNTWKSAFNKGSYDDVTDFGKMLNNMQEREGQAGFADLVEAPGYLGAKAFGASDETAGNVGNLIADIGLSIATGNATDLNDVGKTIKYLNKADKVDEVGKVARNIDEASKLAKESMSFDDFAKSYKTTAEKLGKNIDEVDLTPLYERHIKTTAEKLMKDTNKYLGGINDFDGLKLGEKTIISKESLKNISSNKLQKGLLEVGLSVYSPVGAVMNSSLTNAISEQAMKLETVQGMVNDINNKIRFGSNNQYVNQAIKEFKEGNYDEVLKNVAQKQDGVLKKRIRDLNITFGVMKADKMQKAHGDDIAKTMSELGEEPETIIKRYEDAETTITNPAYIKKLKDTMNNEFNIKGKEIEDIVSETKIPKEKLEPLQREIEELDNLPKISTINFSKQLKALNIEGNEKYFNESISMSLDELTELLKADKVDNAYDVAKRLKTASSNVIELIKERNPALAELAVTRKEFTFESMLTGDWFEVQDINTLNKELKKYKAKQKIATKVDGKENEYLAKKISGLELEIQKQKEYKLNTAPTKEQKGEMAKAIEDAKNSKVEIKENKNEPKWLNKMDSTSEMKGSDTTVTGGTKVNLDKKKQVVDLNEQANKVTSNLRQRVKDKITEYGYEMTPKHMKDIDLLSDEQLKGYMKILEDKKKFEGQTKIFTSYKNEDADVFNKSGKAYQKWFEDNGMEAPEDIVKGLTTLIEYRKEGIETPFFNYKNYKDGELIGNTRKLQEIEVSTKKAVGSKYDQKTTDRMINLIMEVDGGKEELNKIISDLKNRISSYETQYDTPLSELYKGVYKYAENSGLNLSPVEKNLAKNNPKEFIKAIEKKYKKKYKDMVKYLTPSEIDIIKNSLNVKTLPPIQEATITNEITQKIFNKQGAFDSTEIDTFDLSQDVKKRESWAGEQHKQVETKEYTGGDNEYKAKSRGEEVDSIIKQKKKEVKYNNREAVQDIGEDDLREWVLYKSNVTKKSNPELSERYKDLAENGKRVDLEIAVTEESVQTNRFYNRDKILDKAKTSKIEGINKKNPIMTSRNDVFKSLGIDTKDLSKWTNFEQGVFYDTLNFDKNLNVMSKKFPVAYSEIMKVTKNGTDVNYNTVKYVSDFIKMPNDYENIKKNISKKFDDIVVQTEEDISRNIEEAQREFNLPKDKPITSTEIKEMQREAKIVETPIEVPVAKQEPVIEKPKTVEKPKVVEEKKPVTTKIIGLEFDLGDKKVFLDEDASLDNIERVATDYFVGKNYIYTEKINAQGFTQNNTNNIFINPSVKEFTKDLTSEQLESYKKNFGDIIVHEQMHWLQNAINNNSVGGEEIVNFMKSTYLLDNEKIAKIAELVNSSGVNGVDEKLLRMNIISGYVNRTVKQNIDNIKDIAKNKGLSKSRDAMFDNANVLRETDAVIGSMILSNNQATADLAKEVFGKEIYANYMKSISKYSDVEFKDLKKMVNTSAKDELNSKLDSMRNLAVTINESEIANKQEYLVKLGGLLEEMDFTEQSADTIDGLLDVVKKYKDINPESFNKAIDGISEQIKVIKSVEVLDKVDNLGNLTKEQLDDLNFIKEEFVKFGKKEGIIRDGEEQLFANYMYHMINPKLKSNEKAMKLARETFGNSMEDVFNVHNKSRKYKGTIKQINEGFKNKLEENGIEALDLFETNIFDIYTKRVINHENYMLNKNTQDMTIKRFGMKDIKNFQKEVDTIDNLKENIKYFFDRDGITDYDLTQIAKDFENSNKTLYQFLRTEYKNYGIKNMFEEDIRHLNGETYAKNTVNSRFKTTNQSDILDIDYVIYDKHNGASLVDEVTQNDRYQAKLKAIEELREKGLVDRSWVDNRAIAEEKGLRYVDNSMVRVEAYHKLTEEARYVNFGNDTDAYYTWRKKRGQELRRELRNKYKKDSTVHFAFNDVEVNYQSAYKDMMENMMSSGEYVVVTKVGNKNVKNFKTIGEDVELNDFPSDALSDYSVVDKSSVRNRSILESNDEYYVFKKDNWDNYQKELKSQTIKDKSTFLKAYDKISGLFKAQALASGRFITNSAFGNFFESYITSGVNLTNPKMIKQFMKYKNGEDIDINGYNAVDIRHAMEQFGALETESLNEFKKTSERYSRIMNSKPEELTPMQKLGRKTGVINPLSTEFGLYKGVQKTQGEIEEMSRFINVATHLSNGKSMAEALDLTQKALFDYSDLTDFEKGTLKRIIPFYTFMRNNMPLQLENLANKTGKMQRVQSIYTKADNTFNDDRDRALRPDYLNNALSIGKNKFLNLPNPINDLEKLVNPREFAQGLNPLIKTPIEIMLNKQLYSGYDISKYDKTGEKAKYALNSVVPMFNQFNSAINKAKEGDYKSLANIMGVPIKTFDFEKAEKQTMYEYVTQLENQYYELLENNPELKEILEQKKNSKKNKNTFKPVGSKNFSPLAKLINN